MSIFDTIGKTLGRVIKKGTGQSTDLAALLHVVGQVADKKTTDDILEELKTVRVAVAIAALLSPQDPHVKKATQILSDAIEALK